AALKAAEAEVAAAASASEAVSLDAPTVYAGNYYVLCEGWYALDESIVLDKPLVVEGDVKIVLSGGNTLTARAGILAKTDATITLYGEKSAAGSLVVRKGIVRVLTKDERTERDERIAKIRETDPAYDPAVEEVDPQILFVWPCLEVTAGNRDPWPSIGLDKDKEDPNPELAPARVEEPVLNKDLLTQGYVNIKLLTKHSMLHEGESLLLVDGHYECTVCGGWFDDPDGNVRIEKTVEEKQEISQRQSSALASRAPKTETEVILSPGVKAQLGLSQGSGSTSNTTTGTSSATSLGTSANKGTDASSALALTAQVDTVTISFDANGGSGTMDPITVNSGESFVLPECTFTPPEGKVFNSWNLGKPGSTVSVPIDTTLKAWWKDGSGSSGGNSSNNSSSSANNSSSSNTSGNTSAGGGSSANSNANSSSSNANANSSNSNTSSNAQSKSSAQDQPQTGDNLSKLSAVAALLSILGLVALDRARAVRE
ncbi:MAG: InlB B-repeat-containing protein, partial [Coriobacteriales bacterium]|nr:InlB B-repeat-containing protein [Coriobacteriales bacterium]